ncbi:MAG: insulinase family protein [Desulfobulbaceae bacterium]
MKRISFFANRLRLLFFLLFPVLLIAGCASQAIQEAAAPADIPCISRGWPHDHSDLRPDPALRFGTLANGFRFVIMRNEEPKGRVGLYLDIQAGSLAEKDDQRGYAHFLEHMLFNGTTHYPPGTLVEYFQSIGMGFGSDTNAHTAFDETVYRLFLPDPDEKKLQDGLLVVADYARGALLLEEEVERERGIILAEKRSRDSASYRLYEKRTRFSFSGTRAAERFPIGIEETIRRANAESLRAFYDAWYRPENMILVMVGDVDTDLAERLIRERFTSLSAAPVRPECFAFGRVDEEEKGFLFIHEPEIGSTEVSVSSYWNIEPANDSVTAQQQEMQRYLATRLLENRLKQLVNEQGSPLTRGNVYSGEYLRRIGYVTMQATVDGEKWSEGLALLTRTLRQALESGFTGNELDRVKKEIMAELRKEVQTRKSRDSRKLAMHIVRSLNRNDVFLSPEQELELYGPVVESMTVAEANRVFRKLWERPGRKILVAGTAKIEGTPDPDEEVRKVYEQAMAEKLTAWKNSEAPPFPYLPAPEKPGTIANTERFDHIDAVRYTFAGGTVLNVKQTDFRPNEIEIEVHFGHGRLSEPVPGLAMLAASVVNESGVGRLTKTELEEALAGHTIQLAFRAGEESFVLKGGGLKDDFELLLELARTRLLDPAFREDAYRLSMERFDQMYTEMAASVEGMMRLRGDRFLAGGNPRYGMPPREEFLRLTLDQARDWLAPILATAPLEISVVGDIEADQAAELIGRYFGAEQRALSSDRTAEKISFPSGKKLHETVESGIDKALVTIAWPTDDFWDISRTRRFNVLAAVLGERLRLEIRERLGAAYSPQVYNHASRTAPGYGVLRAMLTVDPGHADELAARVRDTAAMMAKNGVTEEELKRSLEPVLTSIRDMMRTNRYWLQSVLALSSRHPEQLGWPLTIQEDFAAITPEEMSAYANRYLDPSAAAEIIFRPTSVE